MRRAVTMLRPEAGLVALPPARCGWMASLGQAMVSAA